MQKLDAKTDGVIANIVEENIERLARAVSRRSYRKLGAGTILGLQICRYYSNGDDYCTNLRCARSGNMH
jgi:hypothetical protein